MNEILKEKEIIQYRMIFADSLNGNGTLFGGTALKWMDETAYILATQITRKKMVTVSIDKIKFLQAVKPNSIAQIRAKLVSATKFKMNIAVELVIEEMFSENKFKALESGFVFAAINNLNKPVAIF